MYITKSLFVDYTTFPKLARWKRNDVEKYKFIKKIESEEDQQKIIRLGQEVEGVVAKYLESRYQSGVVDLFSDIPRQSLSIEGDESEDDDLWVYEQNNKNYIERINDACERTLVAIRNKDPILYQPSFLIDSCFVRADFMVLNEGGQYDLLEVKAKTTIRKSIKHNGQSEHIGEILKDLKSDVSFQKYVINRVLEQEGLGKLSDIYLVHLNKNYVKNGPIDVVQLVKQERVDMSHEIVVLQGKADNLKERKKTINDMLMSPTAVEETVSCIREQMSLSEDAFNSIHSFPGNKYVEYFGEDRPFGTIMGRGIHHSKANTISELYEQEVVEIVDLDEDQQDLFISSSAKEGLGSSRKFIDLFLDACGGNNPVIDHQRISDFFADFSYPICFYDYETISVPIPYLDNTYPYQQVVIQYSLHKYYDDGSMKHYGGIYVGEGERSIRQATVPNNANRVAYESEKVVVGEFKDLLQEFINDIGDDWKNSSFIVWNKGFENARNKEIGKLFPDLEDAYLAINERTYDLMEVVSKDMYFDLGFQGSASIKKVLPVLVPEMSYDGMEVGNGGIAMEALYKLISQQIDSEQERKQIIQELLRYCGQDSLAMVRIYEGILKRL